MLLLHLWLILLLHRLLLPLLHWLLLSQLVGTHAWNSLVLLGCHDRCFLLGLCWLHLLWMGGTWSCCDCWLALAGLCDWLLTKWWWARPWYQWLHLLLLIHHCHPLNLASASHEGGLLLHLWGTTWDKWLFWALAKNQGHCLQAEP